MGLPGLCLSTFRTSQKIRPPYRILLQSGLRDVLKVDIYSLTLS
jgi:hypothetical protein